ncbi:MAG: AbrB/MazE/SpoVT family DNA-binding domain-containing protein [Propionibacteriaceae bacterium]|jgi:bifunctional DNA-binding transcriptional regulator/antitoxin component of YhaV-PrlF toxin-antitoxin module|nr:AbrB/MazE/SpoVT family DNA-binding domain-containing protein [Propionibacteriaceae bacterium]
MLSSTISDHGEITIPSELLEKLGLEPGDTCIFELGPGRDEFTMRRQSADDRGSTTTTGKPRHRWTAELSTIPFHVDHEGATATVFWQARNELRVLAGATLVADAPLNKDGSLGFAARFALTLREEHKSEISGTTTTADIVLRSVNEVGHLLYFAGTNSWLVLTDANGKTLDEWSRLD